jgi:hypothetical protein
MDSRSTSSSKRIELQSAQDDLANFELQQA